MAAGGTRREQLADAAIEVLAVAGMRGLTHRAVDHAAGLPEGSCSYYFRTRQALLQAAVDRLAELDAATIAALPAATGDDPAERATEAALMIIEHWTGPGRSRTLARHELVLESTRRPELRTVLQTAAVHARRPIVDLLAAAGIPDPGLRAKVLVACVDGLIIEQAAGPDGLRLAPSELRTSILRLMRSFAT